MTSTSRRTVLAGLAALAAVRPAAAQANYPQRPVRVIVPYAAGGGTDTVLRIYQRAFEAALGQSIVPEYAGGAGTLIGTQRAAMARPDGYTLLLTTSAVALNTVALKRPGYALGDLAIIAPIAQYPYMLIANDKNPFTNLAELVAYAKSAPDKLNYVTLGNGSPTYFLTLRMMRTLGISMVGVTYPGSTAAQLDFDSNRVQLQMVAASKQYIAIPGKRIIAVMGDERLPSIPEVPTFKELGYPDLVGGTWFGLFAPHGVPDPIMKKLQSVAKEALAASATALADSGHFPVPGGIEGFPPYVTADLARWKIDVDAGGGPMDN